MVGAAACRRFHAGRRRRLARLTRTATAVAGARSRLDPRRRRAAAGERAGVPLRPGRRAFLGGALAAGGDILGWSSQGDINAGRGSKSTIICTPPKRVYDHWGNVTSSSDMPSTGAGRRVAAAAPPASARSAARG
ncbi:filamentous haemagglutinin family protein [Janthinobacterium sp. PSPC2-1]|uniref:filamentous haemagglutinin family protein n=1 Tax=unclassified Janthinobacterium TaxID=2610881 RepID=UPI003CF8D0BB